MSKTVNTKILLRNDTAARWTSENPVLGKGEIGVEIDTTKFKFGDGITAWNSLPYASGADIDLANASKNGLLSKEDFVKLQNIETGAEVNVIETVKRNGNIGLAAHNRGYKVNYFQNLKKLKEGDEIIYKYKEFEKRYVVKTLKIISDEDWSLLENTEDNRITLITCVENEPQYRRAVQAIEV